MTTTPQCARARWPRRAINSCFYCPNTASVVTTFCTIANLLTWPYRTSAACNNNTTTFLFCHSPLRCCCCQVHTIRLPWHCVPPECVPSIGARLRTPCHRNGRRTRGRGRRGTYGHPVPCCGGPRRQQRHGAACLAADRNARCSAASSSSGCVTRAGDRGHRRAHDKRAPKS